MPLIKDKVGAKSKQSPAPMTAHTPPAQQAPEPQQPATIHVPGAVDWGNLDTEPTPDTDIFSPLKTGAARALDFFETKTPASRAIPAGLDEFGQETVKMGWEDAPAWHQFSEHGEADPERSDALNRLSGWMIGTPADRIPTVDEMNLFEQVGGQVMSAANMVNDVNERVGSARRGIANNVEPEYEWITPQNNTYTDADIQEVWKVDGRQYTSEEYNNPTETIGYREVAPGDPSAIGEYNGVSWTADAFKMPDGHVIPADVYMKPDLAYRWFPDDGTIIEYGDGTVPEETQGRLHKQQINANWAGPEEARFPWQDTAGNSPVFDKDWDPSRLVSAGEGLSSVADLFLGSSPYFVPYYRYGSAAARSLPAALGYDMNAYEPTGEGFENLGNLGNGRWRDSDMTLAQRIGGAAEPWIDAWAEHGFSDKAIGGIPNFLKKVPFIDDFISKHPGISNIIGGAVTEAIEEAPSVLPGALARDSLVNIGREATWNPETQKYEYSGPLGAEIPQELAESMAAGGLMGGIMAGGGEVIGSFRRGANGRRGTNPRPAAAAPRMTDEEIRALDTRYQNIPEE